MEVLGIRGGRVGGTGLGRKNGGVGSCISSLGPKKGHDDRGRKDSLIIKVGGFSDGE